VAHDLDDAAVLRTPPAKVSNGEASRQSGTIEPSAFTR
jgi:hypothetical protein